MLLTLTSSYGWYGYSWNVCNWVNLRKKTWSFFKLLLDFLHAIYQKCESIFKPQYIKHIITKKSCNWNKVMDLSHVLPSSTRWFCHFYGSVSQVFFFHMTPFNWDFMPSLLIHPIHRTPRNLPSFTSPLQQYIDTSIRSASSGTLEEQEECSYKLKPAATSTHTFFSTIPLF